MEVGAVGHNIEMGLPKDYPCQVCFNFNIVSDSSNKMAAVTKNRNFVNCPLLLYYKSK
jgi:uncharacterized membrane protein